MQQGKAEENQTECWWCGISIKFHQKSDYDGYAYIGLFCNTKVAQASYQKSLLEQARTLLVKSNKN